MGGVIRRPSPPPPAPAPAPAPVTPTKAEVSQSRAASAQADIDYMRQTKAKGRLSTIITGSKGVQDETVTLGRRSLLGR